MTPETVNKLIAFICILAMVMLLWTFASTRRISKWTPPEPDEDETLNKYDTLPPGEAVAYAWSDNEPNPHLHEMRKDDVRAQMPLLARALDRLVEE